MSSTWTISAAGRLYGPYSAEQMQNFAAAGRLAPHSLIARDGAEIHSPAADDPEIALLFRNMNSPAAEKVLPVAPERPLEKSNEGPQRFGRVEADTRAGGPARFVVLADIKSSSLSALEEEVQRLGAAYAIGPQSWLVTSEMPISELRNRIVQKLGKLDSLFVADTSNNKAVWFNFGPEADAKLRFVWQKAQENPARRAS